MMHFLIRDLQLILVFSLISFCASVITPGEALAQDPPKVDWVEGPTIVNLGDEAKIELGEDYLYLNGEDTRELMDYIGNIPSDLEVGCIIPKSDYEEWMVIFEYNPIGYVKDDEKDTLDSKAILESIKEATEEANKIRIDRGFSALNVLGWYEEPHYDVRSHNLVWAILGEDADTEDRVANYNTRLLGRHGYMSVTLVEEPDLIQSAMPNLEDIFTHYSWNQGKSYTEWVKGDKVAEIGLTALIAGGAGAALAATGILAKLWKFLVVGVLAIIGAISGLIKRLLGKNKSTLE